MQQYVQDRNEQQLKVLQREMRRAQRAREAVAYQLKHLRGFQTRQWSSNRANLTAGVAAAAAAATPQAQGGVARDPTESAEAGPSKTPRAQHPLALVGKLLQQLKKDTLQNICEVSGNKEELIMRIADAM